MQVKAVRIFYCDFIQVSVYYGADIEVSYTGSGFPNPANHNSDLAERSDNDTSHHSSTPNVTNAKSVEYYAKHPWNLLNLPNANGSLLQSVHYKIPGNDQNNINFKIARMPCKKHF